MRDTAAEPYFWVTYCTTRSRPATEKSVSMSGMLLRPGVEEALEEQVVRERIEIDDPQRVGHQRAGGRSAARPHADAVLARPQHVVPHDQEVAGEAHLGDDAELEAQALLRVGGRAVGVAPGHALAAEPLQVHLGRLVARHREPRQLDVAERQAEGRAALGDLHRHRQGVEEVGQRLGHLGRGLEVELLRVEAEALRVAEDVARLDGQQGLVRVGVLAARVVGVAGRDHRQAGVLGQAPQVVVDAGLHVESGVLDLDVDVVAPEDLGERVQLGPGGRHVVALEARAHHAREASRQRDDALAVPRHQLVRDARLAVVALEVARPSRA